MQHGVHSHARPSAHSGKAQRRERVQSTTIRDFCFLRAAWTGKPRKIAPLPRSPSFSQIGVFQMQREKVSSAMGPRENAASTAAEKALERCDASQMCNPKIPNGRILPSSWNTSLRCDCYAQRSSLLLHDCYAKRYSLLRIPSGTFCPSQKGRTIAQQCAALKLRIGCVALRELQPTCRQR